MVSYFPFYKLKVVVDGILTDKLGILLGSC